MGWNYWLKSVEPQTSSTHATRWHTILKELSHPTVWLKKTGPQYTELFNICAVLKPGLRGQKQRLHS